MAPSNLNYGYPQYMYPTNTRPAQIPYLRGRLVSSIEEARAQSIDFDGTVFYFPDLANSKIYTKQINPDGTSTLNMYELKEMPKPITASTEYVTRQEFNAAIDKLIKGFDEKNAKVIKKPLSSLDDAVPDPIINSAY